MQQRTYQPAIVLLITLSFYLVLLKPAIAENLQLPQQVIEHVSDTLQNKMQDKAFTQDFVRVTQYVNELIQPHTDFDKIAPLVLGKHWKTASPSERQRFKQEFQTLIVRAYSRAFVEYKDWTINYLPLEMAKDAKKVIVRTKVLQPRIQPVLVDYRMFVSDGNWKVYDILIDGVSLVTTYRSSFNEDIQRKGSLSALIDEIASRNTKALKPK